MNFALNSPSKAIQEEQILGVSRNDYERRELVRPPSQGPPKTPNPQFAAPKSYSPSIPGIRKLKYVSVRDRATYIPHKNRPQPQHCLINGTPASHKKWRKVILSRFLLENGDISFVIGTKFGDIVTRDPEEILLPNILEYVSFAELERFENEDFLAEDRREEEQARLEVLIPKKRGRPKKSLHPALVPPDSGHGASIGATSGIRTPKVSAVIPSFNGPQPVRAAPSLRKETSMEASSTGTSVEPDANLFARVPKYSMMQTSDLAPPGIAESTPSSRDISACRDTSPDYLGPYRKRRNLSSGHSYLDTTSPLVEPEPVFAEPASSQEDEIASVQELEETHLWRAQRSHGSSDDVVMAMDDREVEREKLLNQFRPDHQKISESISSDDSLKAAPSASHRTIAKNVLAQRLSDGLPSHAECTLAEDKSKSPPSPVSEAPFPSIATPKPPAKTPRKPQPPLELETQTIKPKTRHKSMTPHFPHYKTPKFPFQKTPPEKETLPPSPSPPTEPTSPVRSSSLRIIPRAIPPAMAQLTSSSQHLSRPPLSPSILQNITAYFKPKSTTPAARSPDAPQEASENEVKEDSDTDPFPDASSLKQLPSHVKHPTKPTSATASRVQPSPSPPGTKKKSEASWHY